MALAPLAACSSGGVSKPTGAMELQVGALKLDDITNARYRVTVTNNLGDTVWEKEIASTDYGDGKGAATYVGTCDASADAQPNTVKLDLLELYTGTGGATLVPPGNFVNPTPVSQSVRCVENADVLVTFNLTVMRSANQGFFDIAVNFDDIFCSAKLDCQEAFLHDPATGVRGPTAVVAFACTAGAGQDTTLYWGDAAVVCRDTSDEITATYRIDPAQPGGQHGAIRATPGQTPPGIFEHATYLVDEAFDDQGIDKCAWNLALGLTPGGLGAGCTFEATATAAAGELADPPFHTPRATVYPIIRYQVPLTDASGALVCEKNPLNGTLATGVPSGVQTEYTTLDGVALKAKAACGEDPVRVGLACSGTAGGDSGPVFTTDDNGQVVVTLGDQTFGPFALPPDAFIAQECCADPCCEDVQGSQPFPAPPQPEENP